MNDGSVDSETPPPYPDERPGEWNAFKEIRRRSEALRAEARLTPPSAARRGAEDSLEHRVHQLSLDAVSYGRYIDDPEDRQFVKSELLFWRMWNSETLGVDLRVPALSTYEAARHPKMSREVLIRELTHGGTVHRRLIENEDFSIAKDRKQNRNAFAQGKMVDCTFKDCNFDHAQVGTASARPGESGEFIRVAFVGCSWFGVNWAGARAADLKFQDTPEIEDGDFRGASFSDILMRNFGGSDLKFQRTGFTNCKFDDTSFTDSNFELASFTNCILNNVEFNACSLRKATFYACEFEDVRILGGHLDNTLFAECGLQGLVAETGRAYDGIGNDYPSMIGIRYETSLRTQDGFRNIADRDIDASTLMPRTADHPDRAQSEPRA